MRNPHILLLAIFLFLLMPLRPGNAMRALSDSDLTESSPVTIEKKENNSDTHLQPIDETQLDDLSPSLVAQPEEKEPVTDQDPLMRYDFQHSICFQKCHQSNEFTPSDHTVKQWRLLIEADGHAIFENINWDSEQEKEEILNYLLQHSKDSKPAAAGIGVW